MSLKIYLSGLFVTRPFKNVSSVKLNQSFIYFSEVHMDLRIINFMNVIFVFSFERLNLFSTRLLGWIIFDSQTCFYFLTYTMHGEIVMIVN